MPIDRYLSAAEAARRLGVSVPTLYAYVSRGLLHSHPGADARSRRYLRSEVEALRERSAQRRSPERAAARALDWGSPVLESSLTLIDGDRFFYRGLDVLPLAREATLEEIAGLLWCGDRHAAHDLFGRRVPALEPGTSRLLAGLAEAHPGDRAQLALRLGAIDDPGAVDPRFERRLATGAAIVQRLAAALAPLAQPVDGGVAAALVAGRGSRSNRAVELVQTALVACADHELNVSAFTARCVASASASPWEAVTAGLAALRGTRHGGHSDRTEALLHDSGVGRAGRLPTRREIRRDLSARLRRGETLPGFGHRLYPQGDPRFELLSGRLRELAPRSRRLEVAMAVAEEGRALLDTTPNLDFGLATLSLELGWFPGGAFSLFALGRSVGWIAHALEQYRDDRLIRPRSSYVGPAPDLSGGARG